MCNVNLIYFCNFCIFYSVFPDVATAFESWSKAHKIAIYSTGSVESQKLLFGNTINGDLTSHINNYYDQKFGLKTEPEAYTKIVENLGFKPEETVFITDSVNGMFLNLI